MIVFQWNEDPKGKDGSEMHLFLNKDSIKVIEEDDGYRVHVKLAAKDAKFLIEECTKLEEVVNRNISNTHIAQ